VEPGIEACGTLLEPLTLADLVSSKFWNDRFYQAEEYEWQPTLFQPVGGMDKIWHGFLRTPVGKHIRYNREVAGVFNVTEGGQPKVKVRIGRRQRRRRRGDHRRLLHLHHPPADPRP
jgi:hypothetical protein